MATSSGVGGGDMHLEHYDSETTTLQPKLYDPPFHENGEREEDLRCGMWGVGGGGGKERAG